MSYTDEKGFKISEGLADEITLSNGKKLYTGINSLGSKKAKKIGLNVKQVKFEGCCIYANINQRAKDKYHYPIEIDGVDIYSYIGNVAEHNEPIK